MISIESFTAERKADVGEWFSKLGGQSKDKLPKEDSEKAPTGDGYIVTLELLHWHYEKDNPLRNHIQYVEDNFLRKLQQLVVEVPGYPLRDVRRMGITHATITNWSELQLINYSPTGALGPARRTMPGPYGGGGAFGQFGAPAFAGQNFGGNLSAQAVPFAGGGGVSPGQPGAEDVKQIYQSACTVQFVFQPVAADKRAPLPEPAPPAEQGTDAAAAPTTPASS
jgi:type IV pilus assembly protein PilM